MLKRTLKMYPPIYQIVKLLYVNFKSKKIFKKGTKLIFPVPEIEIYEVE